MNIENAKATLENGFHLALKTAAKASQASRDPLPAIKQLANQSASYGTQLASFSFDVLEATPKPMIAKKLIEQPLLGLKPVLGVRPKTSFQLAIKEIKRSTKERDYLTLDYMDKKVSRQQVSQAHDKVKQAYANTIEIGLRDLFRKHPGLNKLVWEFSYPDETIWITRAKVNGIDYKVFVSHETSLGAGVVPVESEIIFKEAYEVLTLKAAKPSFDSIMASYRQVFGRNCEITSTPGKNEIQERR